MRINIIHILLVIIILTALAVAYGDFKGQELAEQQEARNALRSELLSSI